MHEAFQDVMIVVLGFLIVFALYPVGKGRKP